MRVLVNKECILCGLCGDMCPEVFEMGDEIAFVKAKAIENKNKDCCREAADECPVDAIEIEE